MLENKHISKLSNAPLKEIIFDIRWELDLDENSNKLYDSNFDLALGKFHNLINDRFDKINRINHPFIPKEFVNYVPQFRFFSEKSKFPLVQIGEGILSINDNDESYEWNNQFYPLIQETLKHLCISYNHNIKFNRVSLRYIDSISLKEIDSDKYLTFLSENLNYVVSKNFSIDGNLEEFNYSEKFNLPGENILRLNFSTAVDSDNDPELVWQYILVKEGIQSKEEVLDWAESAHKITSDLFRTMLKKEFYDSFR